MAEFDIAGSFFSPESLKSFQALEAQAERTAKSMKEIATQKNAIFGKINTQQSKAGGSVGDTKEFNALVEANKRLTKSMQELEIQQQRTTAEMQKNTVTRQNSNATLKLQATLVSENSTSLQKMYAQMKLLEIEMQSKFNPALKEQSKEFQNLNAQHSKLQQEYQRTSRATGVMGRSMNSMYGSTFQLTQVMRELPNFAIDARIGFMALSNNLPMLADSFKQLKQQIIDTEGAAGATRKTWAAFGKSLLSLNTIMIVVSTAFIMFGDDLVALFTGKVTIAQKAVDELIKSIKEGNGEFTSASKTFFELSAIMQATSKGFISQQDAIDEYNKAFGATNGYVKTYEEAQQRMLEQTPNYIKATLMKAYAESILAEVLKDYNEAAALRADMEVTFWDKVVYKATQYLKVIGVVLSYQAQIGQVLNKITGGDNARGKNKSELEKEILAAREAEAKIKDDKVKKGIEAYKEVFDNFAEFSKKNSIDWWGDQKKPKKDAKGEAEKAYKNILEEAYYFDQDLQELMLEREKLELRIQKNVNKGVEDNLTTELNAYQDRIDAAKGLQKVNEEIARRKLADDIAALEQNRVKSNSDNEVIHNKNVTNFGANSAKGQQSLAEFEASKLVTQETFNLKKLELESKFGVDLANITRATQTAILAVHSDMYADEIVLLERKEALKQSIIDAAYAKESEAIKRPSLLKQFGAKLGIKTNTKFDELSASGEYKNATYANQKNKLDESKKGATGEQQKDIDNQLAKLAAQKKVDDEKLAAETELAQLEMIEDAKASIVSDSIETLKSLWDSYYAYLEEKIDEQLKKDTQINDERLAQYEDETKVGKHTADELDKEKKRSVAYQTSLDEEAARKKAELEKEQFLIGQLMASGQVWINYAINMAKAGGNLPLQGWLLASAIASQALIAAQTIPAFEEGGDVEQSGISLVGEKRHELVYNPKTGKGFITPDKPTYMYLEKGMHVYPDINKLDLDSFNRSGSAMPYVMQDDRLLDEMKMLRGDLKRAKAPQINGMRLMQQLQFAEKNVRSGRGILN